MIMSNLSFLTLPHLLSLMLSSLNQHLPMHILIMMCHLLTFFPLEVVRFETRNNLLICRTIIVTIFFSPSSTPYPMANYISYSALSEPFHSFIKSIKNSKDPQKYLEAMLDQLWRGAMKEEIDSQERTKTWSIYTLPPDKKPIGCKWLYKTKYHADGTEERKKGLLVGKGYTQEEGVDYQDTFSVVAKLSTIRVLIDVAAKMNWSLTQLEISIYS